jgi:predicted MFS family arabinose efflux permease
MLAVYAVVDGNRAGWGSLQTLVLLGVGALLIAAFLLIESRVRDPLMPLRLFASRNVSIANLIAVAWAAGMFGWFVLSALYLQKVLGYAPLWVGLAFVPTDVVMAAFSLGLSARVVTRFGLRGPLWIGLAVATAGLLLFARAPLHGSLLVDVLPPMLLLGLGAGLAFNPLLLAAMNEVKPEESGLASGVVNTSFMMGGALGLALLASLADARTAALQSSGAEAAAALNGGYHLAFLIGAGLTALGALLGGVMLREKAQASEDGAAVPAQ